MAKYVVFLRHTDALPISSEYDEKNRPISLEGEKEAKSLASGFKQLFRKKTVTLVTSDYTRSIQTAQLAARKLHVQSEHASEFVRSGAYEPLRNLLDTVETEVVMIVGHQPYLSDWALMLTGQSLPFSKGSAACLKMNEGYQLTWWMNAQTLGKLAKKSRE